MNKHRTLLLISGEDIIGTTWLHGLRLEYTCIKIILSRMCKLWNNLPPDAFHECYDQDACVPTLFSQLNSPLRPVTHQVQDVDVKLQISMSMGSAYHLVILLLFSSSFLKKNIGKRVRMQEQKTNAFEDDFTQVLLVALPQTPWTISSMMILFFF